VPTTVPEVVEKRNELHVYPNPVKNSLNIETANISAAEEVLVFDILGNKVLSERISEKQFSLSTTALHPGVYFIKVGNQVKRVIKE
jgi:hypothetical protein